MEAAARSGPGCSLAMTGPLADLQVAPPLGGAGGTPAPEVAPPHERFVRLVTGAATTCPSDPAAPAPLVAAVVGTKGVLG